MTISLSSSLKDRVISGSLWTVGGHAAAQSLRLISNLILTRWLAPEAFGVMSLVWVVMYGLEMLSDVGIAPAVVRDPRGETPQFLNTAWTLQFCRGAILWAGCFLVASPVATAYGMPLLADLVPVVGFSAVLSGFSSTAVYVCRRRMVFKRLTYLSLGEQIVTFVTVLVFAYKSPTIWSLVWGSLAGRAFYLVASHYLIPEIKCRPCWDRDSFNAIFSFGKWIFFSSLLALFANQGDRMLLGFYLDAAELGSYSIAFLLFSAIQTMLSKLNQSVALPAFGRIARDDIGALREAYFLGRILVDVLLVVPVSVLFFVGGSIVETLYDERYHSAGWMFELFSIRLIFSAVSGCTSALLLSRGFSKYAFFKQASVAGWVVISVPVAWLFGGIYAAVLAVALCELPGILVLWYGLAQSKMLSIYKELRTLTFVAGGMLIGYLALLAVS